MLYRISGLTQVYGMRTVLDIQELEIREGGLYALLGPNGAGKTTLLDILAFLVRPSSGRVEFQGTAVDFSDSMMKNLRKKVVMVDQHPILFTATVQKNVEFGLKVRGVPKKERGRRVDEALERVGMKPFSSAMAHRLSGGETQRVALARALVLAPEVLLCDEPVASVDVENQSAILRILKEINEDRKISLIFTTHDRMQALRLARETLYLEDGKPAPAGHENVFSAMVSSGKDGRINCVIENGFRLNLPYDGISVSARRVRIEMDPTSLLLSRDMETTRNRFQGKIVQITREREGIRVVADIGLWVTILMDETGYRTIGPMVGDEVSVTIPSDAVRII